MRRSQMETAMLCHNMREGGGIEIRGRREAWIEEIRGSLPGQGANNHSQAGICSRDSSIVQLQLRTPESQLSSRGSGQYRCSSGPPDRTRQPGYRMKHALHTRTLGPHGFRMLRARRAQNTSRFYTQANVGLYSLQCDGMIRSTGFTSRREYGSLTPGRARFWCELNVLGLRACQRPAT